jgi:hypothetical protein
MSLRIFGGVQVASSAMGGITGFTNASGSALSSAFGFGASYHQ